MPFVKVKCTSCGGEIQLDDEKESGFCLYCGTKVIYKEAIQKIELVNLPKVENLMKLAIAAFTGRNYVEAIEYYNRVLELDGENWEAILYKGFSRAWLSTLKESLIPVTIANSERALAIARDKKQNNPDELDKIKVNIALQLEKWMNGLIVTMIKTNPPNFGDIKYPTVGVLNIHLSTLENCLTGYEYCISLINDNLHSKEHLILLYERILWLLVLMSKHRKLVDGRLCSIGSEGRKRLINRYQKYLTGYQALAPSKRFLYEIEKKDVEGRISFRL